MGSHGKCLSRRVSSERLGSSGGFTPSVLVLREHRGGNEPLCLEQVGRTRGIFASDIGLKGWPGVQTRRDRRKDQS